MSSNIKKIPAGGLARKLTQLGLLNEEKVLQALSNATQQNKPFMTYLIEQHFIDPMTLAITCAQVFGMPFIKLDAFDETCIPDTLLSAEFMQKLQVLPIFRRDNCLFVAIADPAHVSALEEIKYKTGLNAEAILVEASSLQYFLENRLIRHEVASIPLLKTEDTNPPLGPEIFKDNAVEEAPVVRFINNILLNAVKNRASDIHFEPYETYYRIRFRQDGLLFEQATPPISLAARFAARLKIMAQLDIAEKRIPQDGRFKMEVLNRSIDFRISTCPTLFGEKAVIRILDPNRVKLEIETLGFEAFQKELFLTAIHKPQGMILVTGPTGSGKTRTLYTALNILNTLERNISTCEDPIEMHLPGINQIHVNLKTGLTFAIALRAFLRQDPDVMMVGEMRDLETAEIAINAAQTGHLVLSTLHTNSASDTLTRLLNIGIPAYMLAASITVIVAQRLARLLCPLCKTAIPLPEATLLQAGFSKEELPTLQLFGPVGCRYCKSGYQDRIGLYEILPVSSAIRTLILSQANAMDIQKKALEEGMWDLQRAGLEKVKQGLTSLEELSRIIKD